MGTTAEKLAYLSETKTEIKNAIVAKGVEVPEGTTFREYADLISGISTGLSDEDLAKATATPRDVTAGKTFYAGNRMLKTGEGAFKRMTSGSFKAPSSTKTISSPSQILVAVAFVSGTSGGGVFVAQLPGISVSTSTVQYYNDTVTLSNDTITFSFKSGKLGGANVNYAIFY